MLLPSEFIIHAKEGETTMYSKTCLILHERSVVLDRVSDYTELTQSLRGMKVKAEDYS